MLTSIFHQCDACLRRNSVCALNGETPQTKRCIACVHSKTACSLVPPKAPSTRSKCPPPGPDVVDSDVEEIPVPTAKDPKTSRSAKDVGPVIKVKTHPSRISRSLLLSRLCPTPFPFSLPPPLLLPQPSSRLLRLLTGQVLLILRSLLTSLRLIAGRVLLGPQSLLRTLSLLPLLPLPWPLVESSNLLGSRLATVASKTSSNVSVSRTRKRSSCLNRRSPGFVVLWKNPGRVLRVVVGNTASCSFVTPPPSARGKKNYYIVHKNCLDKRKVWKLTLRNHHCVNFPRSSAELPKNCATSL